MSRDIIDCPKCGSRYSVAYEGQNKTHCDEKDCNWTITQGWDFPKVKKLSKQDRINSLLDEIEKIRKE